MPGLTGKRRWCVRRMCDHRHRHRRAEKTRLQLTDAEIVGARPLGKAKGKTQQKVAIDVELKGE